MHVREVGPESCSSKPEVSTWCSQEENDTASQKANTSIANWPVIVPETEALPLFFDTSGEIW